MICMRPLLVSSVIYQSEELGLIILGKWLFQFRVSADTLSGKVISVGTHTHTN